MPQIVQYDDNFTIVIPLAAPLHTADYPFCFDPTCSCHKNRELRNAFATQVYEYILDGIMTVAEAERLLDGRMV